MHAACTASTRRLPLPRAASPRIVCPPIDSRQGASAFNQPLSFNTSSVTDMGSMFAVRSSSCSASYLRRGRPPPAAPRPVYLAPHRIPFFRLSAERPGVQPDAELRHIQRHRHGHHVLGGGSAGG
eukprot:scaffold26050_cov53-Phaeocystis_antarctica.AAC.1